ncbi:MAG: hypothetical protein IZT55_03455 [Anaerolineae bacterium]|nr:hypothetical protein [Anaerolineae bacterium]
MTKNFDLILHPIVSPGSSKQSIMPGLHIAVPPRRCARGRSLERIIIFLTLMGNAPLSPSDTRKIVSHLERSYYQTPGSSTAAMRSIAEWLNDYLLKRNQGATNRGMQAAGFLTLAVVRSNRLYIAQSGPGHTYLMKPGGVQHFHRPDIDDRGLGIGRITHQNYFTGELVLGDKLLITPNPVNAWTGSALGEIFNLELGELRRQLIRHAGDSPNPVFVSTEPGKGDLRILRPPLSQELGDTIPVTTTQHQFEPDPNRAELPMQEIAEKEMGEPISPKFDPATKKTDLSQISETTPEQPPQKTKQRRRSSAILSGLALFVRAATTALHQASKVSVDFLRRMLPDEQIFSLPTSTMALIAIAVPLIVTTIAASVYFQRGQGQLYAAHMLDAQGAMAQARQFEKESEQYIAWGAVKGYLDLAETYRITEESQSMRNYATIALDTLDRVTRIQYFPAVIDNLPVSVEIMRIIPTRDNDLYLLNGSDSTVLRVVRAGQKFRLDTTFRCGPVPTLSGLIDIVAAPPNAQGIAVMGIDAAGNILQCMPGGAEPLNFPMPLTDYHEPRAITMDQNDLFLLTENAVWIYSGEEGYRNLPSGFFGDQVPAAMGDIVDFSVRDGILYLLHGDGQLTTDQRDKDNLKDPDLFHNLPRTDNAVPIIEGVSFSEMHWAVPPDSALYFLDADTHSIYRFNPQLIYQQQYKASTALPDGRITAFATSPSHQIYIAMGYRLFFAQIP